MTKYEIITLWVSGLAALVATSSMFVSAKSYFSNKRSNKATLLHQVKISIDDAKTQLENRTEKIAPLKSKKKRTAEEEREYQTLLGVYESSLEKVINAYEDGCQKYYANLIIKKEFKKSYFGDIRNYVENFEDKFTGPVTRYSYILKAYNEWHKPKQNG